MQFSTPADAARIAQLVEWCQGALGSPCPCGQFSVKIEIEPSPALLAIVQPPAGRNGTPTPPPAGLPSASIPAAQNAEWPKPQGWDFRPGEVARDGIVFALAGKPARLLAMLGRRPGTPIQIQDVIEEVWDGYNPNESTVRGLILKLNVWLRQTFELPDATSPVAQKDGACRLVDF